MLQSLTNPNSDGPISCRWTTRGGVPEPYLVLNICGCTLWPTVQELQRIREAIDQCLAPKDVPEPAVDDRPF
jgi:hypothetical protein